jgi:predicted restriction endonuclease
MEIKEFKDVVKSKIIPTTFVYRCTLCGFEVTNYDRHFGLIKMNEHIVSKHSKEVNPLGKEDLYSRKPEIVLGKF